MPGLALARPGQPPDPLSMATPPSELIPPKTNYLTVVAGSHPCSVRQRQSVKAEITTHNGMPSVIFDAEDYYGIMAYECKYTINGRFLKIRPQVETIRAIVKESITMKGSIKIRVYDNKKVFIDIYNEENFKTVYFKHVIEIEGQPMWLSRWTLDFTPEEDSPITPVWVLLPKLPFHLHT